MQQLQYLGSFWADCAETLHVGRHPLGPRQCIFVSHSWRAPARVHVQGSTPDLENGWTDCAQIWYRVGDRLVGCRAKVSLDPVCTCARAECCFQISGMAGPIAFKLGTPPASSDRLEGCFAPARWKYPLALAHVQGSLSRSLVFRPKGVLLVILNQSQQPVPYCCTVAFITVAEYSTVICR